MQKEIIKIPQANYKKIGISEDILIGLYTVANNFRFSLNDPNKHLESLIDEYNEYVKDERNILQSRLETWKNLLGKYYKMICESKIGSSYYKEVSYIFPYRVINSNDTLWMLEIKEGNDYEGGVKDRSYTVDNSWNYDVYLEEISESEFKEKAIESTMHVIDRRVKRLEEEKINN